MEQAGRINPQFDPENYPAANLPERIARGAGAVGAQLMLGREPATLLPEGRVSGGLDGENWLRGFGGRNAQHPTRQVEWHEPDEARVSIVRIWCSEASCHSSW
jgi:hypothetical protein